MPLFALQVDGKRIPFQCHLTRKDQAEPALEVADFIMHAAGGQVRGSLKGRTGFRLDFQSVFQSVEDQLASYMSVEEVVDEWI